MSSQKYKPGQPVIYRMPKHSTRPGPRAKKVEPARHGDEYSYTVDKFWVVGETRDDDTLVLYTRRGKRHEVKSDNPNLRHVRWWEWLLYRSRFPSLRESTAATE